MKKLPKWNSARLYREHTMEQLTALNAELCADPANANPQHTNGDSIYLYTKETHKKLDAIAMAITWHVRDLRDARR